MNNFLSATIKAKFRMINLMEMELWITQMAQLTEANGKTESAVALAELLLTS